MEVLAMDNPEVKEIANLFDEKLYYEVYQKIETFLESSTPKSEECLQYLENIIIPENIDLYNREALGFNIHSLEYATLCLNIGECRKAASPGNAIRFMNRALEFLSTMVQAAQADRETQAAEIAEEFAEAQLVIKTNVACLKFLEGVVDEAKAVLREGELYIGNKRKQYETVDSELFRQHYKLAMHYYRDTARDANKFLEVALHFLSYTSLPSLDKTIQMGLARDITWAAIFSEDTFNFGKVLFHPIMNSLDDTKHADLKNLLRAFDSGDMDAFEKFKGCLQNLTEEQSKQLEIKMRLMALMVMFWKLDTSQRVVQFRTIEQKCKLRFDRVELALMKAMSKGLIEGQINQVKQCVSVTKVQPRDIDKAGVGQIITKVDNWLTDIDKLVNTYNLTEN